VIGVTIARSNNLALDAACPAIRRSGDGRQLRRPPRPSVEDELGMPLTTCAFFAVRSGRRARSFPLS